MTNKKKTLDHFDGLVMEVPSHGEEDINNQQRHLIVGQKLLCVDQERTHKLSVPCQDGTCSGFLDNDRSDCKNKQDLASCLHLGRSPFVVHNFVFHLPLLHVQM